MIESDGSGSGRVSGSDPNDTGLSAQTGKVAFATVDTGMRTPEEQQRRRRVRYRTVEQGLIDLNQPGRQQIGLSPQDDFGTPGIRITQIILRPWESIPA